MMQSAFLFGGIFPPPAACAKILAGLYRAGTGRAADADKTLVVQSVVRDVVLPDVCAHLVKSPVEERVKFEELVACVPFQGRHVLAVGRLFGADTRDPELLSLQCATEGFHFSDMAARFAVFNRIVEGIGAFFGEQAL